MAYGFAGASVNEKTEATLRNRIFVESGIWTVVDRGPWKVNSRRFDRCSLPVIFANCLVDGSSHAIKGGLAKPHDIQCTAKRGTVY